MRDKNHSATYCLNKSKLWWASNTQDQPEHLEIWWGADPTPSTCFSVLLPIPVMKNMTLLQCPWSSSIGMNSAACLKVAVVYISLFPSQQALMCWFKNCTIIPRYCGCQSFSWALDRASFCLATSTTLLQTPFQDLSMYDSVARLESSENVKGCFCTTPVIGVASSWKISISEVWKVDIGHPIHAFTKQHIAGEASRYFTALE